MKNKIVISKENRGKVISAHGDLGKSITVLNHIYSAHETNEDLIKTLKEYGFELTFE